ncbi:DUF2280 domain-containing protein [Burkholderia sp. AU45274]|uniref:DUF2280 domain-containing protein n=1 Tax=Burkholderia sp. AU45274 TaxID=3059205 RepID=UPI00265328E9|nr:DUF2280 domain-containing protein [Burkholderia sp. AU45274]MDN7490581.1 DUF2280 domain-containing protein [Burkholderia sp. AU45274]
MAALAENVKLRIVQALACFDTPSQVAKEIKAEFGLDVAPQQCEAYDPNKRAGQRLSDKYRAIFEETRKTFLEDTSLIGVSHRAVRLRTLQRMIDKCEAQGNVGMVAQLLEQVAKETGDAYTNRHRLEHTGKDGGPIKSQKAPVDLSDLTDEELEVLERLSAKSGPDQG